MRNLSVKSKIKKFRSLSRFFLFLLVFILFFLSSCNLKNPFNYVKLSNSSNNVSEELSIQEFQVLKQRELVRGYVYEKGDLNSTAIILAHPLSKNCNDFESLAIDIANRNFSVYSFDYCGGVEGSISDGTSQSLSIVTLQQDLTAVLFYVRGLKRYSKILLCAYEEGALASILIAPQFSNMFGGLILFSPSVNLYDEAIDVYKDKSFIPDSAILPNINISVSKKYFEDLLRFDPFKLMGGYEGKVLLFYEDLEKENQKEYYKKVKDKYKQCLMLELENSEVRLSNELYEIIKAYFSV